MPYDFDNKQVESLAEQIAIRFRRETIGAIVLSVTGKEMDIYYVAEGRPLLKTVMDLLIETNREMVAPALLAEMLRRRPDDDRLRGLVNQACPEALSFPGALIHDVLNVSFQEGGRETASMPSNALPYGLQKNVRPELETLDLGEWAEKLLAARNRVCRVEVDGRAAGTGFLVGPRAVLTNWHVVENAADVGRIACRFGYVRQPDGTRVEGEVVGLAADGVVVRSAYGDAEKTPHPDDPPPGLDQLDFALLELATAAGETLIDSAPRRWFTLPEYSADLKTDAPLLIVQHPDGAPMKLAIDTQSVLQQNAAGNRVRYRTNTANGSSGSPVFDLNWNPVLLHHLGDPAWHRPPNYNQGVPLYLIRRMIAATPRAGMLGEDDTPLRITMPTDPPAATPTPAPTTATVVERISALTSRVSDRLADPALRDEVIRRRLELQRLCEGLDRLDAYKGLHAALHELQTDETGLIVRPDTAGPDRLRVLKSWRHKLQTARNEARNALGNLPENTLVRAPEERWFADLCARHERFDGQLAGNDAESAVRTLEGIWRAISRVMSELDSRIYTTVSQLPLEALADALEILTRKNPDLAASAAIAELRRLAPLIIDRIKDHNSWQSTADNLSEMDALLGRDTPGDMEAFRGIWSQLNPLVLELVRRIPARDAEEWLRKSCEALGDQLAGGTRPDELQLAYSNWRGEILQCFRNLDSELRNDSKALVRLRGPLEQLLEESGR